MRFHWLRDRIDQGRFRVLFVPGKKNLADLFTNALLVAVARHKVLAPFFAVDDDSPDSIDLRLSTILFAASLFTLIYTSHLAPSGCVDTTVSLVLSIASLKYTVHSTCVV